MPSIELWMVSWLLDVSLKAALLAAAAWAVMAVCRVRSNSVKHRAWLLVLLGILLLPAFVKLTPSILLPGWLYPTLPSLAVGSVENGGHLQIVRPPIGVEPSLPVDLRSPLKPAAKEHRLPAPARVAEVPAPVQEPAAAKPTPLQPSGAAAATIPQTAARDHVTRAVLGIYLAGVILLTSRLLIGLRRALQIVRRARAIELPPTTNCRPQGTRIVASTEVVVPLTIGYLRPTIVLPADWHTWSQSLLAATLAHEGEHVRRHDPVVSLLAAMTCVLYWFHPVAWLIRRQLTELAEQICDDAVLQVTGSRNEYAQHLLELAGRLTPGAGRLRPVGVAMARQANVVKRIEAIINNERPLTQRIGPVMALVLLCVAAPLVFLAAGLRGTSPSSAAEAAATAPQSGSNAAEKPAGNAAKSATAYAGVKGRVVMAGDGTPVVGAAVRLMTSHINHSNDRTTTTGADGRFEFPRVDAGKWKLIACYRNFASRTREDMLPQAKAGDESIVLPLRPAPSLHVQVLKQADGAPLPGATVALTFADVKPEYVADANGEVTIPGLTPEHWRVETRARGFAQQSYDVNLSGTGTTSLTSRLPAGAELFGVVRDEAGRGLPKVGITLYPPATSADLTNRQYTETAADGSYRFRWVLIGKLTMALWKQGFDRQSADIVVAAPPGGQQEMNVTLRRRPDGGSVCGTVRAGDGKPIAGAAVVNRGNSSSENRKATTDAAGGFRLDDVYKTWFGQELFVKAEGFAPQRIRFQAGDRQHPAEVNVTMAPGHRIRGRVVDIHNRALADVTVYYAHGNRFPEGDFGGNGTTDAQGRFAFNSLPAHAPFAFTKRGYSPMDDVTLPLDGPDEVLVTMLSAGEIRGRVVDSATGKPVREFSVHVTFSFDRQRGDPSGSLPASLEEPGSKFGAADGTFRMGEFMRGMPLQVTVVAEGCNPAVERRVVATDDPQPVEFRLTRIDKSSLLTIAGRLVDERGKPLPYAEMRLIAASKRPFPRDRYPFNWEMIRLGQIKAVHLVLDFLAATTDAQGRFRFTEVRPGNDIEIAYWGDGVSQGRFEHIEQLSPQQQTNLTITATTPGVVHGTIDKKAYPEISEVLLSGNNDFFRGSLSPKGDSYEVRNVPPGSYELQVYGPYRPSGHIPDGITHDLLKRIRVTVKSGETLTVDIAERDAEIPLPVKTSAPAKSVKTPAAKPAEAAEPLIQSSAAKTPVAAPVAAAAAEAQIVLVGTVKDESGNLVEGAKLWLPAWTKDGEHIAEATTTAAGKFTLPVPAEWAAPEKFSMWVLWCYAKNQQIATARAYAQVKKRSRAPIDIVLKAKTDTGFIVTDPAGKPVAGARVEPWSFLVGAYDILPRPMRDLIAQETDRDGRALLPSMSRDGFSAVQVTAAGYGVQQFRLRDRADEPAIRSIKLRSTGRLEGRLVCDDPAAIKSAEIYVYQEDYLGKYTSGTASPVVDRQGRFVVPEFAEGAIELEISVEQSLPVRPRIPQHLEIDAGKTTRVDVPFEPTVRAHGRVQTKPTGDPVAGAEISVWYGGFRQGDQVLTDADGRFAANVLAGAVRRQLIVRPARYEEWIVEEADFDTEINVPAGVKSFDLPPLLMLETAERAGRLIDRSHRPVAGANIMPIIGNRRCAFSRSDKNGQFTLRLPPSFRIEKYEISRSRGEASIYAPVISESPLVLQVVD